MFVFWNHEEHFINGLMFAAAALLTGRLSAAIGLNISWNLAGIALFWRLRGRARGVGLPPGQ